MEKQTTASAASTTTGAQAPAKKAKKLNLALCIALGAGSIIGAGIFSTTPIAIGMVGPAICWVFLLTAIYVCLRMLPSLVMSSALPANGGDYMHVSRLLNGNFSILLIVKVLMHGTMNIAVMCLTCGEYVRLLFPDVNLKVAAIVTALIFAVIGTFGARISGIAQFVCVGVLLVALATYIFGGFGNIQHITMGEILAPTFRLGLVWAAMGMLNGTLMGGNSVIAFAEEVDNPGKVVPLAFFISTIGVSVIYAIFAFVTIGVVPHDQVGNIGEVAATFMSPAALTFFITGGALLAVATTINGCLMMYAHQDGAAARDGLLPGILGRYNSYNAPYGGIWLNTVTAILAILSGFKLAEILAIGTCASMFLGQIGILPIFLLKKKYPLSYKNSFLGKVPYWLCLVLAVGTTYLSFEFGISLAGRLSGAQWAAMILVIVALYGFMMGRVQWLKRTRNVDVFANMRSPYERWETRETELRERQGAQA